METVFFRDVKQFRMKFLPGLLGISLFFSPANIPAAPPKKPRLFIADYENVLGTSMELKVNAASPGTAEKAQSAVLHEIARLSAILSGYDPASEFSRWQRTSNIPVHISPELFEVLGLFDQWRVRTGGALDASAEVVTRLWKQAAKNGQPPTVVQLAQAVAEVKQRHWRLDSINHTATHLTKAPLMLNSFAKSYIIRHAADAGRKAAGADAVIVNIGGDIVVSGNTPETIDVSDPKSDAENATPIDRIRVNNLTVATSGNYRRGELIAGRWYSHIVDPRTGQPADNIISATVVAPNATDAGALATAFNVLTPTESVRLAQQLTGVDYLVITTAGDRIESPGWKTLELPAGNRKPEMGAADDFELLIDLQIKLQEGFAKRPYVAVWVEDENHAPVRTISVWHGVDKYMPELKSWYLKYRDRYKDDQNFHSSITSATRSAGKYTVKWDGRDDQGKPVKPGKYVIKIEASREHGTYQLMRQEIAWDDTPKKFTLPGNAEIAAVSFDYTKSANAH